MRNVMYGAGLLMMLLSLATPVAAGLPNAAVPEINGGSLMTGLGLLSGSVLILRARFGSKRK